MITSLSTTLRAALLTSALVLGFAIAPALADRTYEFPKEKPIFTITYPDSWSEIVYSEDYVEYGIKDEVSLGAWILADKKDIKEAAQAAGEEVVNYVKDFKVKDGETKVKVNGLDILIVDGTGIDKTTDKPLTVQICFFSPDNKTICALLYYGVTGVADKYQKDVTKIVQSLKAK